MGGYRRKPQAIECLCVYEPDGRALLSWSLETAGKVTLIIATAGRDGYVLYITWMPER